jgi:hypothetical protein
MGIAAIEECRFVIEMFEVERVVDHVLYHNPQHSVVIVWG